ncbi:MAG: (2Fe-2S)-binding protein [Deltaproteobacteria bacterium]|nr:(2Fe-2S)-binding protein [Deltaproteobacteria bacterium]
MPARLGVEAVIVCHCRAKNDREIRRAVRNGAVTLQEVSRACGAASACGGCAGAVHEIIASELGAFEPRSADLDLHATH